MARQSKKDDKKNGESAERASPNNQRDLSGWRVALFTVLVPIVFFAVLELLLAIAGVKPALYENDPYVGFSSSQPLYEEQLLADGTAVLRTAPNKFLLFNAMQFPRDKSTEAFRIFCTGGSTTYGRPYTNPTSFCGWLRQFLAALDPARRWEVVNAGGISYASYRVALLTEELIEYEPDLLIVYSGHNEFLEKRTYEGLVSTPRAIHGLTAWLRGTRIYGAMERLLEGFRTQAIDSKAVNSNVLEAEVKPLLDSSIGPDAYHRDDELRDQILRHYRFNLARSIDIASSVGARTIMVTPASNLANTSPFKSEYSEGLSQTDRSTVRDLIQSARQKLDNDQPDEALVFLNKALSIDDRYALAWFLKGRALEKTGRFDEAVIAYERARDEDIVPLRALTTMGDIVRDVAAERDVALIDFLDIVEERSANGIAGESLFLDHVHPTIEGNRLLALAIIDEMRRMGIVRYAVSSPAEAVDNVTRRVMAGLDRRSHGQAMMNLSKVQAWAGQLEEAHASSLRAVELAPREIAVYYQAGITAQMTGRYDEAIVFYKRVIAMEPAAAMAHGNLGDVQSASGRTDDAASSYREAIRLTGDGNPEFTASLEDKLRQLD
jgi:tetratricopeptide (TPR) repeat protein